MSTESGENRTVKNETITEEHEFTVWDELQIGRQELLAKANERKTITPLEFNWLNYWLAYPDIKKIAAKFKCDKSLAYVTLGRIRKKLGLKKLTDDTVSTVDYAVVDKRSERC